MKKKVRLFLLINCLTALMLSLELPGWSQNATVSQEQPLVFPMLLEKEQQAAGNPLTAYAEMLRLEPEYLKSKIFTQVYPEVRAMYEENMGVPLEGAPLLLCFWKRTYLPEEVRL